MLIIQTPWTPATSNTLSDLIAGALHPLVEPGPHLVVLPHGDGDEHDARAEGEVTALLARLAKDNNVYIGASAYVRPEGDANVRTFGFLLGPDGQVLLRTPKVMPDIGEGFTDTAAETFQPAAHGVARTPLGQIGILCGEDILSPHLVRTQVLRGAEIILNPSRERSDDLLNSRLLARTARAYENLAYVALASADRVTIKGTPLALPSVSGLYPYAGAPLVVQGSETVLNADCDIEGLRRRREQTFINFPAIVRMNLYAPGYAKEASSPQGSPSTRDGWIAEAKARVEAQSVSARPDAWDSYSVLLCQHVVHQSKSPDDLAGNHQKNLDDGFELANSYGTRAPGLKLIVFPEFYLTGPVSPLGHNLGHVADKLGVTFPGPVMDQVATFARESNSYVAGGVFEFDPDWPERFFNTAFIYDDQGTLIHRYRKIHCADTLGFLPVTTPGSVYDQYLDKYGYEHLFPVADTAIGKLATVICFDNNFPETHRALTRRGAEVIIHPTSEPHGGHRAGWDAARRMRAFENTAYVLTCGHGGEYFLAGRGVPSARARGYSKIVNFDGSIQAEADTAGQVPLSGTVDLRRLRRARADIKANIRLWDDAVVYAEEYAKPNRGLRNNIWPDDPHGNPYYQGAEIKKVLQAYVNEGIFVAPEGGGEAQPAKAAE